MKKILILIINYGDSQINYCKNTIDNFLKFKKYNLKIKVFCSNNLYLNNVENVVIEKYFGNDFTNGIYDYLKNINYFEYDSILLTENDILYTEENFDYFFECKKTINDDIGTIGFLRYENKNDDRFLIDSGYDQNKISFYTKKGIVETYKNIFFRTENCHQGSWFLSPNQLKKLLNNIMIGNTLEDKVSNFFYSEYWPGTKNGIKKFIPYKNFDSLLVHHQPNKYVNIYDDLPSVKDLMTQL